MIDDISDIAAYYTAHLADEDERLQRHQLEFDLTWRYLAIHLPPGGHILEVGAATGGYTLPLAQAGYEVTAVDLAPALLERNRARIAAAGLGERVRYVSADARDLSAVPGAAFDAALVMGPLYHLIDRDDRVAALQQVHARLRPGGVVVTASISRFGFLSDMLGRYPHWIEHPEVEAIMTHGYFPDDLRNETFRGYFATPDELPGLHAATGFDQVALAGVEPAIGADDDAYNKLAGDRRARWLDLLFSISQERSIVGASRHLLFIGRKPVY